jgi:geranylgeranyl diphosphate synthase, type II
MNHPLRRIEAALDTACARAEARGSPTRLAAAMRHAVMPGGARIRPQLCLAVAAACGNHAPSLAEAAAVAIELMHCASLVHDDLPCFDNAALRRGQASVHHAWGERSAVLAGDALIVLAFESLGLAVATPEAAHEAARLPALMMVLSRSVGMPSGIVAGQALEDEPWLSLPDYHAAKTGTLFAAATEMGALAGLAHSDAASAHAWRNLGDRLGEAYQVADDIRDATGDAADLGKPTGRDRALGRPSAVAEWGLCGALQRFERLIQAAQDAVPAGPGTRALQGLVRSEAARLLPTSVRALAVA